MLEDFKGIKLSIDWDYIQKKGGKRQIEHKAQRYLGKFLLILSIIVIPVVLFMKISIGELPSLLSESGSTLDLILTITSGLLIYSLYLNRNLEEFSDKLRHFRLSRVTRDLERGVNDIEITSYFDFDILDIFDVLIAEKPVNYLQRLLGELTGYRDVNAVITRLGLTTHELLSANLSGIDLLTSDFKEFFARTMVGAFELAYEHNFEYVDERAVFFYLARNELKQVLLEKEARPEEVEGLLLWIKNEEKKKHYLRMWKKKAPFKPISVVNRAYTSGFAGTLNKFSRDYTVDVIKGDFTFSIAREKELQELIDLLSKGKKSAVLLIGDPGVGKTTLLKSLGVRMVVEDVPKNLRDMRLVSFDIAKASATSRNIESFKKKLGKVFADTAKAKNVILVFEDVVQLLSGRSELAEEIVSVIVDALDRHEIRLVITATNETYKKEVNPRTGLMKFLDILTMEEPTNMVAQQILIDMVPALEAHYKIKISFDAVKQAVELSSKVLHDKVLPQKALDVLEEACAKASGSISKTVNEEQINELISKKVGVKIGEISREEGKVLAKFEELLHKRVIDQMPAIKAVADALRRSRAGLAGEGRPIASFLFFGPTGVGKTEVAKAIAETYYGDEKLMIRLDMSEYHEKENMKRLIGYPEGDGFEGGYLTEPVRKKSYSLILLDEIEKAYPKVLDLFLQILDEGQIKDGLGRKVDFTNTIIVATSNASSKDIAEKLEAGENYDEVYDVIMPKLRETFKVELLNRFDKVVMFKPLSKEEVVQVADLFMKKEQEKLKEKGIAMAYSVRLLEELGELGYNPVYGGRELRRVVQERVVNSLAKMIIEGKIKSGSKIELSSLRDLP
ncbi:ATP-dependent Clp protease ATP-binding subunit [Candidatus Dojkabacteria bacterium]|nr:ATP-dependent Clp protease ATP-binding subunit [Candidatus Dojkabacteria bacterium]